MKRTTQAQIGGRLFTLEEDAFKETDAYIKRSAKALAKDDDAVEIIADLESAIADRLDKRKQPMAAVTSAEVSQIIEDMGEVETDGRAGEDESNLDQADLRWRERLPRRDTSNCVIFGVAAGIARELKTDPLFIRIAIIFLGIITAFFPLAFAYILAAIIMLPDDEGKQNANEVIEKVRNQSESAGKEVSKVSKSIGAGLNTLVGAVVTVVKTAIGAVSLLALGASTILIAVGSWWLFANDDMPDSTNSPAMILMWIALGFVLIVPFADIALSSLSRGIKSWVTNVVLVAFWLASLGSLASLVAYNHDKGRFEDIARENPNSYFSIVNDDLGERLCLSIDAGDCTQDGQALAFYQDVCGAKMLVTDGGKSRNSLIIEDFADGLSLKLAVLPYSYDEYCHIIDQVAEHFSSDSVILMDYSFFTADDFEKNEAANKSGLCDRLRPARSGFNFEYEMFSDRGHRDGDCIITGVLDFMVKDEGQGHFNYGGYIPPQESLDSDQSNSDDSDSL